jgi:penicillin amidase
LTFPGVPGVQHFAHAGEVAWAITNAAADYQDIYEESLDDVVDGREETIAVRDMDPVTVEVLATERGPLFEVDRDRGRGLAVRDAPTVLGDLGFDALLPLLRARTVDDVDRALDAWVAPVNNAVIADRSGTVRFRNAGRVPLRAEANRRGIVPGRGGDTWSGWVSLPRHDVPPDGQVVTANERRGSESELLGNEFAPPHRAARIHALLRDRDDLTVEDFAAIHGDSFAITALPLCALVRDLVPGPAGEPVRETILDWDGVMAAGSRGAAAFAAWRSALTTRLCAEPVLAMLRDDSVHGPLFAPYLSLEVSVGLALEPLVGAPAPYGVDVLRLATEALEDAAGHPDTWGETHVLAPTHAFDLSDADLEAPALPATPVSGDVDTVRCTGWLPGLTDEAYRGSVARYVWDLDDRSRSGWVVPMGASGDPRSPHHLDQLEAWADARLLPVELDWERLTPES